MLSSRLLTETCSPPINTTPSTTLKKIRVFYLVGRRFPPRAQRRAPERIRSCFGSVVGYFSSLLGIRIGHLRGRSKGYAHGHDGWECVILHSGVVRFDSMSLNFDEDVDQVEQGLAVVVKPIARRSALRPSASPRSRSYFPSWWGRGCPGWARPGSGRD